MPSTFPSWQEFVGIWNILGLKPDSMLYQYLEWPTLHGCCQMPYQTSPTCRTGSGWHWSSFALRHLNSFY